jgi:hypothetical protein
VNFCANSNNHADTSLVDWLHCHLPPGGVGGTVGTPATFDFIMSINDCSLDGGTIRRHHVSDTSEQVNEFNFRFSGFPSKSLGHESRDRTVRLYIVREKVTHIGSRPVSYFGLATSFHRICLLVTR